MYVYPRQPIWSWMYYAGSHPWWKLALFFLVSIDHSFIFIYSWCLVKWMSIILSSISIWCSHYVFLFWKPHDRYIVGMFPCQAKQILPSNRCPELLALTIFSLFFSFPLALSALAILPVYLLLGWGMPYSFRFCILASVDICNCLHLLQK